ncbi:MAG: hypothetical protein AAB453_05005 [Patescibacteria group bacterium]
MKFDFSKSLVPEDYIKASLRKLATYREELKEIAHSPLYLAPESSLFLPHHAEQLKSVRETLTALSGNLKLVIVIGIGGSSLGAKAVYDAVFGHYDDLTPNRFPKLHFLEAPDEKEIEKLVNYVRVEKFSESEILINVISKSGVTKETLTNFELLISNLTSTLPQINKRVVITGDNDSPLVLEANKNKHQTLIIPQTVGGRFSIFSAVGLLPLLAAEVDVEGMLAGAREMQSECLGDNEENPASLMAIFHAYHLEQGKNIHDTFSFDSAWETLGKWYRQLLAESIGKDGKGITPTVSIGPNDLHSVAQLELGGPKDKTTLFLLNEANEFNLPIFNGVETAYKTHQLPFVKVIMENNPQELGAYLTWRMIEIMLLGKLLGINAFNQPDVEDYKSR